MERREQGFAMITAMCVMAVAVVLSLTLLLSASNLHRHALRSNREKQTRISADAVSEVLREQIVTFEYQGYPTAGRRDREDSLEGKLASVCTEVWQAAEPDEGGDKTGFTYELGDCGLPGDTVLELYWMDETGDGMRELDTDDPAEAAVQFMGAILYVAVTNTVGEQSSTAINRFYPEVDVVTRTEIADGEREEESEWAAWRWIYDGRA